MMRLTVCLLLGFCWLAHDEISPEILKGIGAFLAFAAVLLTAAVVTGQPGRAVKVGHQPNPEGIPAAFTLTLGTETVVLDAGKAWVHVDRYKWVTRGLIEEPQSFHVQRDGTVEINGEKIRLDDPEGVTKLEHEINKRHEVSSAPRPTTTAFPVAGDEAVPRRADRVQFRVRLDHLGHLMIECMRGSDRVETGVRGLQSLIQNGLMLKPQSVHIDPLQRSIDVDGVRFEASEAGAREFQDALNARYAPAIKADEEGAIEIRENPASATGFDIHFATIRAGARFEVKGHLSQAQLEILQDQTKCDLLRPGVLLRLTPPYLLIRKRRPDGGEERIPEIPDIRYLHANAVELQQLFNHPLIRRGGGRGLAAQHVVGEHLENIVELRVVRNPMDKSRLWLECVLAAGTAPEGRALTHPNVADLQQSGVFLPHLDVTLSFDHRTLRVLNKETNHEDTLTIDVHSSDEDLLAAGRRLTAALKPPKPRPAVTPPETRETTEPGKPEVAQSRESPAPATTATVPKEPVPAGLEIATLGSPARAISGEPSSVTPESRPAAPAVSSPAATTDGRPVSTIGTSAADSSGGSATSPPRGTVEPAAVVSQRDPAILALFSETDPLRINQEIFQRLEGRFGVSMQDVRLSLPRIFDNRRFQIISFSHPEIESVLELRSEEFYGFYLAHLTDERIDFVYACHGTHIEWGTDKCVLQPTANAEAIELRERGLLGMGQTPDNQFVFVVTPAYKKWVKSHEAQAREAFAHFVTAEAVAAEPDKYVLIWPERAATG